MKDAAVKDAAENAEKDSPLTETLTTPCLQSPNAQSPNAQSPNTQSPCAQFSCPQLLSARVMHQRLDPKKNGFSYGVYYIAIPLASIANGRLGKIMPVNRFGLHSFYSKDHGYRDNRSLQTWIDDRLSEHGIALPHQVVLITMPRILGYVFNPVSFWLCYNQNNELYCTVNEVNNTFGETHSYLCHPQNGQPIDKNQWMQADKQFHVSPFLPREGYYWFRYHITAKHAQIQIDYYGKNNQKTLITTVNGAFSPLSRASLRRAWYKTPLLTIKVITLIHYQALKILGKKIRHIKKPDPHDRKTTKNQR
ncbi:DUF1365 domain-containing protein [Ostreibacterium oceani]|uniref:DUF1365 family protein n=1 Tax=Ostreibacterium oceani TaxID=2654998 RepID=A0A6N7ESB3_9GAMM|nr:DUF1365 domain-containing protein [Ostreibacterium oceani]MPV85431.1 DUF1365 family protein [Ostreibacterium oceani]